MSQELKEVSRNVFVGSSTGRPPGAGWMPIPRSKHGGYHRRYRGEWQYWYPDHQTHQKHHTEQKSEFEKKVEAKLPKKPEPKQELFGGRKLKSIQAAKAEDRLSFLNSKANVLFHRDDSEQYTDESEVPRTYVRAAQESLDALKDFYGFDYDLPSHEGVNKEIINKIVDRSKYVLGDKYSINSYDIHKALEQLKSISNRKWPNGKFRDQYVYVDGLKRLLKYEHHMNGLRVQSKEKVSPIAKIFVDRTTDEIKNAYFNEESGTRTGYVTALRLLSQIRTIEGINHYAALKSGHFFGDAMGGRGFNDLVNYTSSMSGLKKDIEYLKENNWEKVDTGGGDLPRELLDAIRTDIAYVRMNPESVLSSETFFDSKSGAKRTEKMGNMAYHRFTDLPPERSEVHKYFKKRFGINISISDNSFEKFIDTRLPKKDYGHIDVNQYSHYEPKQIKDVLKRIDKKYHKRFKRLLRLERANYGADIFDDTVNNDYLDNLKEQKIAANTIKNAVERSFDLKRRTIASIHNAFEGLEKAVGKQVDFSNLPVLVSNDDVTILAKAHYQPSKTKSDFDREYLGQFDIKSSSAKFSRKFTPHLAIGTDYEKSLAHEIFHYLDNRLSIRMKPGEHLYKRVGEKTDRTNEVQNAALRKMQNDSIDADFYGYTSNSAGWLVRQKMFPENLNNVEGGWNNPDAKKILNAIEQEIKNEPGGEQMLNLMHAVKDSGLMNSLIGKDEENTSNKLLNEIREKSTGFKLSEEEKLYYAKGTEIVARVLEQHLHHKLIEKENIINPTLTDVVYDSKPRSSFDKFSAFLSPKDFKEKIAPHAEALMRFLTDNMTKGRKLVIDLMKSI